MQRSPLTDGESPAVDAPALLPTRRSMLGLGAVALASVTGCTGAGQPPLGTAGESATPTPGAPVKFTFGASGAAETLDPALVADTDSLRITRQIFEGLVGVDPNTGAPTPGLATAWKSSGDGLTHTFALRRNVVFHDGTTFDADAVVTNFARWAALHRKLGGLAGQAFESVFHHSDLPAEGDADPEDEAGGEDGSAVPGGSYYGGCRAQDAGTFVLELRKPLTGLIEALTLPGFGMASPRALRELDADHPADDGFGRSVSPFGKRPVGTGPFVFAAQEDTSVTLKANPNHWRDDGQIDSVTFEVLRDAPSRLRALRRGTVDGYDMVTLEELRDLVRAGQQVLQRDPFSVLYLGMNQSNPRLASADVRRAAAHAVNRQQLIERYFIAGTKEARGFVPPSLGVPNAETYHGYNPSMANELLEASGYDGEPIPFLYPLNATRAYLPLPERIYAELSSQLTEVGFNIKPVPIGWSEGYVDTVLSGRTAGFHLLGWNGSYRDPDHFIGSLFGTLSAQFGHDSAELRTMVVAARSMPNGDDRAAAYQRIGELVAKDLPALPIAFPISAVAVSDRVVSYPSSPVLDEVMDRVTLAT